MSKIRHESLDNGMAIEKGQQIIHNCFANWLTQFQILCCWTNIHMYVRIYIYIHIIYIHTYICIYTHIHMCIYIIHIIHTHVLFMAMSHFYIFEEINTGIGIKVLFNRKVTKVLASFEMNIKIRGFNGGSPIAGWFDMDLGVILGNLHI